MAWPAPRRRPSRRVKEPGGEDSTCSADRVTMRDGAPFDIDDILGQAEFARNGDRDRGESLVDAPSTLPKQLATTV